MRKQIWLKYLDETIKHLEYYDKLAPFPIYGSELINDFKQKRMQIEMSSKEYYNNEPVYACRHCKHLATIIDDNNNDICPRCTSINETIKFKNIEEYEKFKEGRSYESIQD